MEVDVISVNIHFCPGQFCFSAPPPHFADRVARKTNDLRWSAGVPRSANSTWAGGLATAPAPKTVLVSPGRTRGNSRLQYSVPSRAGSFVLEISASINTLMCNHKDLHNYVPVLPRRKYGGGRLRRKANQMTSGQFRNPGLTE